MAVYSGLNRYGSVSIATLQFIDWKALDVAERTNYIDTVSDALQSMDDLGYERGGEDFANHGPMGAEALAVLGFSAEVPGWIARYRHALEHEAPATPRWSLDPAREDSWHPALGAYERAGDWEQMFRRLLAEHPWRDVLVQWWPRLLPGLFSRLTHGLIRTAHAVRSVAGAAEPNSIQLDELARGLAYWAARFQPLPGSARLIGSRTVADAVALLPRRPDDDPAVPGQPGPRMRGLNSFTEYHEGLDALAPGDSEWLLGEMTTTFAGVYFTHPEVVPVPLIHAVTAPAALRLVLPYLPEPLKAASVAVMWQSHLALLLAFTTSRGEEPHSYQLALDVEPPPAAELIGRALEHGDEHVIKFTEASLREHALRPDPRFPAAILAAHDRTPRRP